jgi:hypothetical protein
MTPARSKIGDALNVAIVCDNAETLDGLENYFQRAGIATRSTRDIVKASERTLVETRVGEHLFRSRGHFSR